MCTIGLYSIVYTTGCVLREGSSKTTAKVGLVPPRTQIQVLYCWQPNHDCHTLAIALTVALTATRSIALTPHGPHRLQVRQTETLDDGTVRGRIDAPMRGWLSLGPKFVKKL